MSDYPAAAGVTRQNILARLLGGDPIQQLPAAPVAPGPQMTAADPGFVPGIAPRMNIMARLLGEPLTTPQAERDAYRDALNAAGWAGSASPGQVTRQGIRAFHGSPHRFDRFDMSRIGTGEGAQAYGHGLYFAQAEDTARAYRDTLGGRSARLGGEDIASLSPPPAVAEYLPYLGTPGSPASIREWRAIMERSLADQEHMARSMRGSRFMAERAEAERMAQASREGIAWLRAHEDLPLSFRPNGSMYEVNLRVDPQRLLDWDAPLSAPQNAPLLSALERTNRPVVPTDNASGGYWTLAERLRPRGAPESEGLIAANNQLRDAGVLGLRYLDGGSRAAGEGSRNYVMFDDSVIDILRRYGIAGLLAGGGASALGSQAQAAPEGGSP